MTRTPIPATSNPSFGFWGTLQEHAEAAWPLAMRTIAEATDQSLDSVRIFLDSRHGRHFADAVQNGLYGGLGLNEAIDAATRQWMAWTINRHTRREKGIPVGLPYLTGWVVHYALLEETVAN